MLIKGRRGQATAELAVFGSLIILVVGVLLSYTRTIREQQKIEQQVFRQALKDANEHAFNVTDIYDETVTDYGATVGYSKTLDKQANLLFEPSRRSSAASYTVFWSGAEDPPTLDKNVINQDSISKNNSDGSISLSRKKITYDRDSEATETSDKELKLSTLDVIALIAPVAVSTIGSEFFKNNIGNWFGAYAGQIVFAVKLASFIYFYAQYSETISKLEEVEQRREELEDQDEQMSKWGWRISTDAKDSADSIDAGKYYVKEVDAQIYDTLMNSSTQNNYIEIKVEAPSQITNNRGTSLTDTVNRNFKLRYDVTAPDPAIPILDQDLIALTPSQHTYEYSLSDIPLSQGLGADRSYASSQVGTTVSQEALWTTPH